MYQITYVKVTGVASVPVKPIVTMATKLFAGTESVDDGNPIVRTIEIEMYTKGCLKISQLSDISSSSNLNQIYL